MKKKSSLFFNHLVLATTWQKKRIKATSNIIKSGKYFYGDEIFLLERNLRKYFKKKYAATLASGHDALLFAIMAFNFAPNFEVIFPVNAYPTAFPVALSNAKLVPVDVDQNGLMDLEDVKRKITSKTKIIIPVHLYGNVVDMEKLNEIVKDKNIAIIEDCAQSFGSLFKGRAAGTFSDVSCFSFYPTKNLGTLGDGGVIVTNNKALYTRIVALANYGEKKRYFFKK